MAEPPSEGPADTSIKAVSPAEGAAVHNIRVITAAGGMSAKVTADRFAFH